MVFYHDISLSNALLLFNINHINEYKFYIHLCKISISVYIAWVLEITLLTFFNSSLAFFCRGTINSLMYFYVDHFLTENICKALFL